MMKENKNKVATVKSENPATLQDVNRARERKEFIDPEKESENKGGK